MSNWLEISAKTVDEALTEALIKLETTSDQIEYEVIEKESSGLLGLFSKPAKIRVCKKESVEDKVRNFLADLFEKMEIEVEVVLDYKQEEGVIEIELKGNEMGLLIGKRGQTLDSIQFLTSLVANIIYIDTGKNFIDRKYLPRGGKWCPNISLKVWMVRYSL